MKPGLHLAALAAALALAGSAFAGGKDEGERHHSDKDFRIEVLSSRPYMVSGGDANQVFDVTNRHD